MMAEREGAGRVGVEFAHGDLIHAWPRLRGWLDEDRDALLERESIREAALEWHANGRDDGYLAHRDDRLERAQTLATHPRLTLNALEQDYLRASVAAELAAQRERAELAEEAQHEAELRVTEQAKATRLFRMVTVLAVIIAILAILGLAQTIKVSQETERRILAEADAALQTQSARATLAGQLALQAEGAIPELPQQALLLAVEAVNTTRRLGEPVVPAAQAALRHALANAGGRGIRGPLDAIYAVAVSQDGRLAAATGIDSSGVPARHPVLLWDMNAGPSPTPNELSTSDGQDDVLAFSPDGRWFAAGERLWNVADPAAPADIALADPAVDVAAIAFSADSEWLAMGSRSSGDVRLWHLTGEPGGTVNPNVALRDAATRFAFSSDSRWFVSAGSGQESSSNPGQSDPAFTLWDLSDPESGPSERTLVDQGTRITMVAFSADGRWLVGGVSACFEDAADAERDLRLWDLTQPEASPLRLARGAGELSVISSLAVSSDGRQVAATSDLFSACDPSITTLVWQVAPDGAGASASTALTRASAERNHSPRPASSVVAFAAGGRWLIETDEYGTVHVWERTGLVGDFAPGSLEPTAVLPVTPPAAFGLLDTTMSQDGRWLVIRDDAIARVWDLASGSIPNYAFPTHTLRGHEDVLHDLGFSADGRWAVTGSADGSTRLWDLAAATDGASPLTAAGNLAALGLNPSSDWLATVDNPTPVSPEETSSEPTQTECGERSFVPSELLIHLRRLSAPDGTELTLRGHQSRVTAMALSPDGRWLASAADDFTARLWDLHALALDPAAPEVLCGHETGITQIAFSPEGTVTRWLATTDADGFVRVWDLQADTPSASETILRGHQDTPSAVGFSPDGGLLVVGRDDGPAELWALTAPDPAATSLPLPDLRDAEEIIISAERTLLAAGSRDGVTRVWRLAASGVDGEPRFSQRIGRPLAFSHDDRWLAAIDNEGALQVWDWAADARAQPRELATLNSDTNPLIGGSGRWVAVGDERGVRLWDLSADDPADSSVALLEPDAQRVSLAMSPDGWFLAAFTTDSASVRVWDLQSETPASSVRDVNVPFGEWGWAIADSALTIAISNDRRWMAAHGAGGYPALLWDLTADPASSQPLDIQLGNPVQAAHFGAGDRWLATQGLDGTVQFWDLTAEVPTHAPMTGCGTAGFAPIFMSPDHRWLVSTSGDGEMRLADLTAPDPDRIQLAIAGHADRLRALAFSRDGRWLVSSGLGAAAGACGLTPIVQRWDLDATDPAATLNSEFAASDDVAVAPDGQVAVVARGAQGAAATVLDFVADAPAAATPGTEDAPEAVTAASLSGDDRWLFTAHADGAVRRQDLNALGQPGSQHDLGTVEERISVIAPSHDGRWFLTVAGATVQLWDTSGEAGAVPSWRLPNIDVLALAPRFSPDGRWLTFRTGIDAAGNTTEFRLWDLTASNLGSASIPLPHPGVAAKIAGFSGDSHWLVIEKSAGADGGAVLLWSLDLDELVQAACLTAGRTFTAEERDTFFYGQVPPDPCPAGAEGVAPAATPAASP